MDDDTSGDIARGDGSHDRLEVELHRLEGWQCEAGGEECGGLRARHGDALAGEVGGREIGLGDDDRAVALAERSAVAEQAIRVLHARVRANGHGGRLEAALACPHVERLDIGRHKLDLEAAQVERALGNRPHHEGVIGVGTMANADVHRCSSGRISTSLPMLTFGRAAHTDASG